MAGGVKENSEAWWSARYSEREYLYGKEPSAFLQENVGFLSKGKTLDVACGEGRNAVFLALKGFSVEGVDFCEKALERAKKLAESSGAEVEFKKADLDFFLIPVLKYNTIVVVDYHPGPALLKTLGRGLAKGGTLLVDGWHMEACRRGVKGVEPFECFKSNELLNAVSDLQVLFYDERFMEGTEPRVRLLVRRPER